MQKRSNSNIRENNYNTNNSKDKIRINHKRKQLSVPKSPIVNYRDIYRSNYTVLKYAEQKIRKMKENEENPPNENLSPTLSKGSEMSIKNIQVPKQNVELEPQPQILKCSMFMQPENYNTYDNSIKNQGIKNITNIFIRQQMENNNNLNYEICQIDNQISQGSSNQPNDHEFKEIGRTLTPYRQGQYNPIGQFNNINYINNNLNKKTAINNNLNYNTIEDDLINNNKYFNNNNKNYKNYIQNNCNNNECNFEDLNNNQENMRYRKPIIKEKNNAKLKNCYYQNKSSSDRRKLNKNENNNLINNNYNYNNNYYLNNDNYINNIHNINNNYEDNKIIINNNMNNNFNNNIKTNVNNSSNNIINNNEKDNIKINDNNNNNIDNTDNNNSKKRYHSKKKNFRISRIKTAKSKPKYNINIENENGNVLVHSAFHGNIQQPETSKNNYIGDNVKSLQGLNTSKHSSKSSKYSAKKLDNNYSTHSSCKSISNKKEINCLKKENTELRKRIVGYEHKIRTLETYLKDLLGIDLDDDNNNKNQNKRNKTNKNKDMEDSIQSLTFNDEDNKN